MTVLGRGWPRDVSVALGPITPCGALSPAFPLSPLCKDIPVASLEMIISLGFEGSAFNCLPLLDEAIYPDSLLLVFLTARGMTQGNDSE